MASGLEEQEDALECPPDQIATGGDHPNPEVPRRLWWRVVGVWRRLKPIATGRARTIGIHRGWGEIAVARLAPGHDAEARALTALSGHSTEQTPRFNSEVSPDESP